MPYKKFDINNYVLYKYKDEWLECRIKDIIKTDNEEYKIILYILKYSILNNDPVPDESVYRCTLENEKKFKVIKPFKIPAFLIDFLREDRTKIKNNFVVKLMPEEIIKKPGRKPKNEGKGKAELKSKAGRCVKSIISDFVEFLGSNKIIFEEELEEVKVGYNFLFNQVIKNLLYDKEMKQFGEITHPYNEVYGIEHLARLLYFSVDKDDVLNEYSYYFCDFLELHYSEYFLNRKYEELE